MPPRRTMRRSTSRSDRAPPRARGAPRGTPARPPRASAARPAGARAPPTATGWGRSAAGRACRRDVGERLPLRPDVDLLPLVGAATGALGADPAVPPEVGRVDILDLEPLLQRQREEPPGGREHPVRHLRGDAVPDDVEEADVMRGVPQVAQERLALPWVA